MPLTCMLWQPHGGSPHTHAVSVAATTSDLSTAERTAPARDAREWMGGEAWRARAGDVSGRGGQLGPQLLPRQEAAAHLFGQVVDLLALRSAGPQSESRSRLLPISTTVPVSWVEM